MSPYTPAPSDGFYTFIKTLWAALYPFVFKKKINSSALLDVDLDKMLSAQKKVGAKFF